MTTDPRIFIVDDDKEVRESIGFLMQSVGLASHSYARAQDYLDDFDEALPGCLILDVRMKGMSGLMLQEHLSTFPVHPPVIIITGHGDVPMAVQAVQAGASDFIEKPFNDQVLLDSIHKAIEQDAKNRGIAAKIAEIQGRVDRLTEREREVMGMVVEGKLNKVIAYDLGISQSTVESHRGKVMEKMEAKTLSDLMRMMLSLNRTLDD